MRILEIGCGEGGVLKAFIDRGCYGVGVELDESRLVNAREWLKEDIEKGKIRFISKDIYKTDVEET
jgi:cyclopropane fatty-acyl-phospholipid synthase-like methyltransferase